MDDGFLDGLEGIGCRHRNLHLAGREFSVPTSCHSRRETLLLGSCGSSWIPRKSPFVSRFAVRSSCSHSNIASVFLVYARSALEYSYLFLITGVASHQLSPFTSADADDFLAARDLEDHACRSREISFGRACSVIFKRPRIAWNPSGTLLA